MSTTHKHTSQAKTSQANLRNKVLLKGGITTIAPDEEANKKLALEEKIKLFERKNELIQSLRRFKEIRVKLAEIQAGSPLDSFTQPEPMKMILQKGYREDLLSISNQYIIEELIKLVINKIDEKTTELEAEIET